MPQTSENVIISGAGDSEIRIYDLNNNTDNPLFEMYVCHSDQVKKICVYNDNPNEFLTCSQDGAVRHFDIRVPHLCSPHSVKSFLTSQIKPARQHPLPKVTNLERGCSRPLVDYSDYNIELNSMTINNVFPHYFAVAGTSDFIYLHDRRMMRTATTTYHPSLDQMRELNYIQRFSPASNGIGRPNKHITSCKFSDSNGYELIGSWDPDSICLFNINDCVDNSETTTLSTKSDVCNGSKFNLNEAIVETDNCKEKTITTLWKKIIYAFTRREYSRAYFYSERFLNFLETLHDIDTDMGKTSGYLICASVLIEQQSLLSSDIEAESGGLMYNERITDLLEKAAKHVPRTWQGFWCKAIGFWLLGGGYLSNECEWRSTYMKTSFKCAVDARASFQNQIDHQESDPSALTSSVLHDVAKNQIYLEMMDKYLTYINTIVTHEGYIDDMAALLNISSDEIEYRRYEWITFMNTEQLPTDISKLSTLVSKVGSNTLLLEELSISEESEDNGNNSLIESSHASNNSSSPMDTEEDEESDEFEADEDSEPSHIRCRSLYISDYSKVENLDTKTSTSIRGNSNNLVVKPRSTFTGHCNIETVKDVDFFGLHDEYIVSGSDEGFLFIWDKKTTEIVQILRADEEVVNVAKGHPFLPLLAVSGIDSTVKIFQPTSRLPATSKTLEPDNPQSYSASSRLYDRTEIIKTNRESIDNFEDAILMTGEI
ncbi:unnamed protein product [Mucor hiemalis]